MHIYTYLCIYICAFIDTLSHTHHTLHIEKRSGPRHRQIARHPRGDSPRGGRAQRVRVLDEDGHTPRAVQTRVHGDDLAAVVEVRHARVGDVEGVGAGAVDACGGGPVSGYGRDIYSLYMYIYIYTYTYTYVCVCV